MSTAALQTTAMLERAGPPLAAGTRVEVRRRFDHAWARGFVVAATEGEGYRLRRTSDGSLLPVPFPPADVRAVSPPGR